MSIGSAIDAQVGVAEEAYTNEVQSWALTGSPTGGAVTIVIDGAVSGQIPYNATSSVAQGVIDQMPLGAGQIVIGGGPWPGTALTATFSGSNVAKRDFPAATLGTSALTGGSSPTLAVTTTTPGSGYGSGGTPTRFVEFVDVDFGAEVDRINSKAWAKGQFVGPRADRWLSNKKGASGTLSLEGVTKGLGVFLKHMFGSVATSTPAGGTLTRDHTFTLGDPWNTSLVFQVGVPTATDIPTSQPFTYVGCKVTDWELSCDVDGILEAKITIDARDERTDVPLASPSYPAGLQLLSFLGATIQLAGRNAEVKNWSLGRKSSLDTDRRFLRADGLKREPILNDQGALTGKFDVEFRDMWLYNQWIAGTSFAMTATFQAATPIEGSLYPMLRVTLPAVRADGDTPRVKGPGIVTQSVPFTVLAPADLSPAVTAVYRTTDTAP